MRNSGVKVVVVGAGIVGCSVADHLTALGWTDVTVVDQGPLFSTGGSTSHAPGLMFATNPSQTMTHLALLTRDKYGQLEHGGVPALNQVGSIEVARTPERWDDLKRKHGLAAAWGVESRLLPPEEVAAAVPLLDAAVIHGGLHVPGDGLARAVVAAEAMAALARGRGATFVGDAKVTGFTISGGAVRAVRTTRGEFPADLVVCCAGMWGPVVGRLAGVPVPLVPFQHQYARTTPIAELAGAAAEATHPILRDQDRAMYFRQHHDAYGVGSYQHPPLPVEPDDILDPGAAPVMPSLMAFTPAHFKQAWLDAQELLPPLRRTEPHEPVNGLFSFTADGMPLIGESDEVRGFWVAEAVWITHAAGVGRATAEWITTGTPTIDLRECDLHRFDDFARSPAYLRRRAAQQYDEVYDVIHPLQPMEQPRPLRVSPFHQRHVDLGATFLEAGGWERPHWLDANAPEVDGRDVPERDPWSARYWSPVAAAEHLAVRERAGLFDMTSLRRAEVTGPGALAFLQRLATGRLDRPPGYATYALLLDERAGILSDVTIARLGEDLFQLGLNGPRDVHYLQRHARGWNATAGGPVHVADTTAGTGCVGLWGPRARDVLQPLVEDDLGDAAFGFFRARRLFVGEVPVVALRVSYVGELGWELYADADLGLRLWDLLWEAGRPHGLIAAGRAAFNALRVEKGYRAWGTDMWSEHDPDEAGLGFAVRAAAGDFIGGEALERRRAEALTRKLCCLTVTDGTVLMGKEPVYAPLDTPGVTPGRRIGFVTSAAYGYSVGASIAYAWLPAALSAQGTGLEVEYFGVRHPATVAPDPIFDPDMERMRR